MKGQVMPLPLERGIQGRINSRVRGLSESGRQRRKSRRIRRHEARSLEQILETRSDGQRARYLFVPVFLQAAAPTGIILTDIYMGSDGLLGVLDRLWMSAGGGDDFLGMTMEALRDERSLL